MQKELSPTSRGFSVVEVLLAGSVFALIVTALIGSYLYGQEATSLGGNQSRVAFLAEEGLEAVRNIRDADFAILNAGTYGLSTTGNQWNLAGLSDVTEIFTRQINISAIGANRRQISDVVSWQQNAQRAGSVALITYLTNWQASAPTVSTCNDAAIQQAYDAGTCRQEIAECTTNGETNLSDADVYCTTLPNDTCCAGSGGGGGSCSGTPTACLAFNSSSTCAAQSGGSWTSGSFGATTNPSFDTGTTNWVYADWEESAGRVSGSRQASGGNPNGYIRVVVAGRRNTTLSGYWQQSFTTTASSPTGTIRFDWSIPSYSAIGLTSYYLYVYVQSTSGAPTLANYAWRSPAISASTNWASVSNVDISSFIPTAGTYYVKVAARGIYNNTNGPGTTIGAFDNVQLNWSTAGMCSGTPTTCDVFGDQTSCQAQGGCLWQ